eukprot:TRINITY_DN50778_c0_g1_i1.p1 TRINITY_DN50778_c0_g1~~TRINITY_DN50778_c0_g1_i1.p1  ORF type:complete len:579 (-),score=92.50 TRINITY_DN50778_c0_g1_i1:218-1954(-)
MFDFDELDDAEEAGQKAPHVAAVEKEACAGADAGPLRLREGRFFGTVRPTQPLSQQQFGCLPRPHRAAGKRLTPKELALVCEENRPGEFFDILFPHSPEQLREWGAEWLTKAFHKAGSIPEDVNVKKVTGFKVLATNTTKQATNADDSSWGGAGMKVMLDVEYNCSVVGIHEQLFVKLPHAFSLKNERHKISCILNNDFPEVMFNNVLAGDMPFRTPKCYYADINRKTTNFIVICERMPYAEKSQSLAARAPFKLLSPAGKYQDYNLPDKGVYHYYAQCRAFARMCAWYQETSKISSQIDDLFAPSENLLQILQELRTRGAMKIPMAKRLEYVREDLSRFTREEKDCAATKFGSFPIDTSRGLIEIGMDFVDTATGLFEAELREPEFKRCFEKEASEIAEVAGLTTWAAAWAFPELFVLAHPNLQVDNAFYWHDEDGEMKAGLLDWGSTCHAHATQVLAGAWHGAEPEVMDEHEDKLCDFFVDELLAAGGECCDKDTFRMLLKCARGNYIPMCFANIGRLYSWIPRREWASVGGRLDERVDKAFVVRCYAVAPVLVLKGYRSRSPYPAFQNLKTLLGL